VEVRNSHFRRDADGLTEQIREVLKLKRTASNRRFIAPAVAVIALVVLGLIGAYEKGTVSLPWPHSDTSAQKAPLEAVTAFPANPAANQNSTMVAPTKPPAPSARPSPDIPTDCDWLAANNSDLQRPKVVPGVVFIEQINVAPATALAACKEAVSNNPDVARFSYQLGPVLDASKDYSAARIQYDRAADLGSTAAMNNIGLLYSLGKGVPLDYAVAKRWYDNAAAAGSSTAMNNIGYLYSSGYGVPQDYAEAKRWYEKAAAEDNADAMLSLGDLYRDGHGVTKSVVDARVWYQKAAAVGSSAAQGRLDALLPK
jgi:tetratricopeptide (TPR) repeat protein